MNLLTVDPSKLSQEEKIRLVRESDGFLIDILEGEKIKEDLDLQGCTSLIHLPEGLKVEEDLILWKCTSLTHLPEGLKVGGNVSLQKCKGDLDLQKE